MCPFKVYSRTSKPENLRFSIAILNNRLHFSQFLLQTHQEFNMLFNLREKRKKNKICTTTSQKSIGHSAGIHQLYG